MGISSRGKGGNPLALIIVLICLIFFAFAAIAAAFKLGRWLWERGAVVFLAAHGAAAVSGLLLYLAPGGWWSWVIGAPFIVWAAVVAVMAVPVFLGWAASGIRQLT